MRSCALLLQRRQNNHPASGTGSHNTSHFNEYFRPFTETLVANDREEFMFLSKTASQNDEAKNHNTPSQSTSEKKYVYGIDGIAEIFGCSRPTASRIKKSGRINAAIRQIGRKIVVDVELALTLAGQKKEARRWIR